MNYEQIVLNRIRTPDGTILTSWSVHDYVEYQDMNGEFYMVDGGLNYLRRNVNKEPYAELSVKLGDGFLTVRGTFHWGTYGKNMDQLLKYKPLCELSNSHIRAILGKGFGSEWVRDLMREELIYRGRYDITVED